MHPCSFLIASDRKLDGGPGNKDIFIHLFRSHLEVGLHHLGEAEKRVVLMKSELEQLQPEVHSKAQVYYHSTYRI